MDTASERPIGGGTGNQANRNGTELRESLPLWNDAEVDTASERPIGGGAGNQANRNGTELRESLPLWNDAEVDTASERSIGGGAGNQANRNGTELRESLPLWNDAEVDTASEWHLGCPLRRHTFLLLRKVNPKGGKTVHLCNRAMPETPTQALGDICGQPLKKCMNI